MLNAFHSEKDSLNLQMILGGFITLLEDTFRASEEMRISGIKEDDDDDDCCRMTNQTKDTIPGMCSVWNSFFIQNHSSVY